MRKILLIIILLLFVNSKAQNLNAPEQEPTSTFPNIIPPSPTAYALGNYGNVPVGLFTGALNMQIPIMEYKAGDITVPIYLFYGSNGIKVDDISGNVGIGWNLNFGGVITKTIRDLDDDLQLTVPVPENFSPGYITNSIINAFYYNAGDILADTEADIYSFNFNGYSGKFIFDQNNVPILLSQDKLVIERENYSKGFSITTKDGTKYHFNAEEKTSFRMRGGGWSAPGEFQPTAWYLSSIISNTGNQVFFEYQDVNPNYNATQSQTVKIIYPAPQTGCEGILNANPIVSDTIQQNMRIKAKIISKIYSNKILDGEINFLYKPDQDVDNFFQIASISKRNMHGNLIEKATFEYTVTTKNRTFLNRVLFEDPNKNYEFEYANKEMFPNRLNLAQDHWGYYNGHIENTNLLPNNFGISDLENLNIPGSNKDPDANFAQIGMLNKITYPTKGFTKIEYEGNDYFGTKITYPQTTEHRLQVTTTDDKRRDRDLKDINIAYRQYVKIVGHSLFNTDCRENLGNNQSQLNVYDEDGVLQPLWIWSTNFQMYTPAQSNAFFEDEGVYYIDAYAGKKYTIELVTYRPCTLGSCTIFYKPGNAVVSNENMPTGGVRVKSSEDFSREGVSSSYKRFYYTNDANYTVSSGDAGVVPLYYDESIEWTYCDVPCKFKENIFLTISSSSIISLFNSGSSNCYYSDVTISHGGDYFEKGGEHKKFKLNRDKEGELIFGNHKVQRSPWNNVGWDNGNEESSLIFDSNKIPIKEIYSNYVTNDNFTKNMYSYSVRKNYAINCMTGLTHTCTEYETLNYPLNKCYGLPAGTPVNLPIFSNLDIMQYKNISYWHYLKSQKTTEYLNGTPVQTTTEYFFNNPSHYQMTSQKTTFPDLSTQTTEYQYAHEKGNTYLIGKNMVGIPLQTKMYEIDASKPISNTETLYPTSQTQADAKTSGLALPYEVQSENLKTNAMEKQVSYDKYDLKGNLLQYTTKEGIPVCIVWGYHMTQPIAKIEGATYPDDTPLRNGIIPLNLINTIISASDEDADDADVANPKEQLLIDALDAFRIALPNYQITTYTYDPLIGVRSITPPSGIREIYTYDTSNRLKEVKDVNGNLLKEYQYHYKQP